MNNFSKSSKKHTECTHPKKNSFNIRQKRKKKKKKNQNAVNV